jgi:hypothetical protein
MDCPFTFTVPPGADKEKLRALIAAQIIYERVNEVRLFLVHTLAIMSVLVWLSVGWPTLLSQNIWAFILALWGTCCLATLAAGIMEGVCYRRRARRLAEYEATQQKGAG